MQNNNHLGMTTEIDYNPVSLHRKIRVREKDEWMYRHLGGVGMQPRLLSETVSRCKSQCPERLIRPYRDSMSVSRIRCYEQENHYPDLD